MTCRDAAEMVEERINYVLTQYRESPKLLHLLRTYLTAAAEMHNLICDLPERFDIRYAVGDQLTILGRRLGWGREHCVCDLQPVFGFECEGYTSLVPIADLCDENATWLGCAAGGIGTVRLSDDELYRRFLFVRRRQIMNYYSLESLEAAVQELWGAAARVLHAGDGRVVVAPGRALSTSELAVLQLYPRILPLAPGIEVRFHFYENTQVFGFGDGWGGFCDVDSGSALAILTSGGSVLTTEDGDVIVTSETVQDSPWMCEIDVKPYDC